jgi:hypothetical protein
MKKTIYFSVAACMAGRSLKVIKSGESASQMGALLKNNAKFLKFMYLSCRNGIASIHIL